jgi:hypothetical protein
MRRLMQSVTTGRRHRQRFGRYAAPLPTIANELETISRRVEEYCNNGGASWK